MKAKTSIKNKKSGPQKMKAHGSYEEWKKDQSRNNTKLINALQKLVKKTAPTFSTIVKWGQGCFVQENTPKMFIHTEPDHVQLGFYAGSKLKDPEKLLVGNGKYVRHVKVYDSKDINEPAFMAFIKQVVK